MIDWIKTKEFFNISNIQESCYRQRVVVVCDKCARSKTVTIRNRSKIISNNGNMSWLCMSCSPARAKALETLRIKSKELWENPEYRAKNLQNQKIAMADPNYRKLMSELSTERMKDPKYVANISAKIKATESDPQYRMKMSLSSKKMWENPELAERLRAYRQTEEYRLLCRENAKKLWADPAYREKQKDKPNRSKEFLAKIKLLQPKVSSIQATFYSILDDLNIPYFREWNDKEDDLQCKIGCYSFDCVIPRDGQPTLLVDIHGEYWHSLKSKSTSDAAKATYISTYFKDQYEYKVIWEHEFLNKDKVVSTVKYWLSKEMDLVDFDFNSVQIEKCPPSEHKLLLSKYHYLITAGRGGIAYGAYFNNELIAVCIFSPLIRQNIKIPNANNPRELSRFCVHPKYQKPNFASWFISRCIKLLPVQYDAIISYCDTTYNHDGAIYKASNFILDGEVDPDYWYVSEDGWVMHKKTLYNHATRNHSTEREWAEKMNYRKVWGSKKLRFLYRR